MEDLTEAFLLLARESDDALTIESVNVNDIIHEEVDRAELFNRVKKLPISVNEKSQLQINASDKVLSVLLGNLIRNAILYTESGTIEITVTDKSVIIEDSGVGMSKEEVDNIFTSGKRQAEAATGEQSRATIANGPGLCSTGRRLGCRSLLISIVALQ